MSYKVVPQFNQSIMATPLIPCIGVDYGCPCRTAGGLVRMFKTKHTFDDHCRKEHLDIVFNPMEEIVLPTTKTHKWCITFVGNDTWIIRSHLNIIEARIEDPIVPVAVLINDLNNFGEEEHLDAGIVEENTKEGDAVKEDGN